MRRPLIKQCTMISCSYNDNTHCRARAVTVGDDEHPVCDTFTQILTSKAGGLFDGTVGACKVEDCKHNTGLECALGEIKIGLHRDHPDCLACKIQARKNF